MLSARTKRPSRCNFVGGQLCNFSPRGPTTFFAPQSTVFGRRPGIYLDNKSLDVKMVGMDSSGVHLWLVLMKAYRTLARYARCSVAPSGLGQSDFAILELLLHRGQQ